MPRVRVWSSVALLCLGVLACGSEGSGAGALGGAGEAPVGGGSGSGGLGSAGLGSGGFGGADPGCPGPLTDPAATGLVYQDGDSSSVSWYDQGMSGSMDSPLGGVAVDLLSSGGEVASMLTCPSGELAFSALPAGPHLLDVKLDRPCTSSNRARRFPERVRQGSAKVLTFGDSIPSYGPQPWFPARLATLAQPLVNIENVNVAVPGSTSAEWLPTEVLFTQEIAPHLTSADVLVFSLGGNDILGFMNQLNFDPATIADQLAQLDAVVAEVEQNLKTIIAAIRGQAPDVDIVWLVYPNYARTSYFQTQAGSYAALATSYADTLLRGIRSNMATTSNLLLADMLGATADLDLDSLLVDPLHLNDSGHQFYAEEVFIVLGGVLVDPGGNSRGLSRELGFAAP